MEEWVAFERSYVKDMEEHCRNGMRFPKDKSAESMLETKLRLLLTADEFLGSAEFVLKRSKYAAHVEEFAARYELDIAKTRERIPSTVFRKIVRK